MNIKGISILFLLILLIGCGINKEVVEVESAKKDPIKDANWTVTKVSKGVTWKYFHFDDLFTSKQFITVIDADLNKGIKVDIPYISEGFIRTSEAAMKNNATAAINGSFFDITNGGSVVFFRKDGKIINATREVFNVYRENAGIAVDKTGKVTIEKKPEIAEGGWESVGVKHLLTSGPLMIYDGKVIKQEVNPFNDNRHPRTAVGITKNNHLICVVVDGRSSESYGMSINELARVMEALGCIYAMNLDGGGSSTAWIKEKGVVNHPSDNKLFDNAGERKVANLITITQE